MSNIAEKATRERDERRQQKASKIAYAATTEGQEVCERLIPELTEYLLKVKVKRELCDVVGGLEKDELAYIALAGALDYISGTTPEVKPEKHLFGIKLAVGRLLHQKVWESNLSIARDYVRKARRPRAAAHRVGYRDKDWSTDLTVRAGNFLLDALLLAFPDIFQILEFPDHKGRPQQVVCVAHGAAATAARINAELVYRYPVLPPSSVPLRPWTDWDCGGYWEPGSNVATTFVRDGHPDTEARVRAAFAAEPLVEHVVAGGETFTIEHVNGSIAEHAAGVNSVQNVPFRINSVLMPVVKEFAGKVGKSVGKILLEADLTTAERFGNGEFYVPHNTDFRGRIYGVSNFNYQREDHVRSLFEFANGLEIGTRIDWLAIHCANTYGEVDKKTWSIREAWTAKHQDLISRVAADPLNTVELWAGADAPFSFVAACLELVAALNSRGHRTHLPISFDGSCSGIQHLSLLAQDVESAERVNLTPKNYLRDIYGDVASTVRRRLRVSRDPRARWWVEHDVNRALIKRAVMTFPYSATKHGMKDMIVKKFAEMNGGLKPHAEFFDANGKRLTSVAYYLADLITEVCQDMLKMPSGVMSYIRGLAGAAAAQNRSLVWTTPTGFPWNNRYVEMDTRRIDLLFGAARATVQHTIGMPSGRIREEKSKNAAAPNFVHALDACHAIKSIIAGIRAGITNVAVVHDSFAVLAPQAQEFNQILRRELMNLYLYDDVLTQLRVQNGLALHLPDRGEPDMLFDVQNAEYAFA